MMNCEFSGADDGNQTFGSVTQPYLKRENEIFSNNFK
jgi:hypothetical protein